MCFLLSLVLTPVKNVSLASNRLSSLTIGDSDRRSSGAPHPSADLPAEGTGNDRRGGGVCW